MTPCKIAYVGTGAMGGPFAGHLAATGHTVSAFDSVRETLELAADSFGLTAASSVAAAVEDADFLFTCLPDLRAVEGVYAVVGKPGLICCDNSTVGPGLALKLHQQLLERGMYYVECPMLGDVEAARAGALFLLLSGRDADVARVLPIATAAAKDYRIVGGPGTANLFKTVQNGLGHAQMVAIAEALALVAAAGGDLDRFIDVVGAGGGMAATGLFRSRAPMMRDPNPAALGALYIAEKDIALAAALAEEQGLDVPCMARAAAVYAAALRRGLGNADMAAIARVVEDEAGVRIAPAKA